VDLLLILMHVVVLKDPTNDLIQIAEVRGMLDSRFHALSLGQGQAPFATRMLKEGVREVFRHRNFCDFLNKILAALSSS